VKNKTDLIKFSVTINSLNKRPLIKEDQMNTTINNTNTKVGKCNDTSAMKIENLPVNSLVVKYHPRNTLGDIESLQGSIKRDGLQEPLMVYDVGDNQYAVIDGVRRLAAIQEFGWQNVPCLIYKGMDASDAAHISYVKNTERNSLNPVEIALHLKAMIDEFGYNQRELELKGYGSPAKISGQLKLLDLPESIQKQIQDSELTAAHGLAIVKLPTKKEQENMAKQIKDFDLSAKKTEIRISRYLDKGKKKVEKIKEMTPSPDIPGVYFKDSRDMSELPDKSVHLIVSSPPYGVGMEYEKGVTYDEHLEMLNAVMDECGRVLIPGGVMALNVGDIYNFRGSKGKNDYSQIQLMGHKYQSFLRKHRIYLKSHIIWKKTMAWTKRPEIFFDEDTNHTSYKILDTFEPVYIFRKEGKREIPSEDVVLRSKLTKEQWKAWVPSIWEITPVKNMEGHPSIYPDELVSRLIKMYSYEGDMVLDPFLGSGTTVKVARELHRDGIGYEREIQYKPVIMKKLGLVPEPAIVKTAGTMAEYFEKALQFDGKDVEPPVEVIPVNTRDLHQSSNACEPLPV
jgi:modification methylase